MNRHNVNSNLNIHSQHKSSLVAAEKALISGDIVTAESEFRKLVSANVNIPNVYSQLALICAKTNRLQEAKSFWEKGLIINPSFVDSLLGLGDLARLERNYNKAISFYKKAIENDNKNATARLNLSFCLLQSGQFKESEEFCKQAIAITPQFPQAYQLMGEIAFAIGDLERAENIFKKQLTANPKNVQITYLLGNLYKSKGKLDKAAEFYQQALNLAPSYTQAHFSYASIHKYKQTDDKHILMMSELEQNNQLPQEGKLQLAFALAKAYEDINDYDKSFKYLDKGNAIRYQRYQYSIETDVNFIASIIKAFSKEAVANIKINAQDSQKPIFIVGMPRSGTTLIEKILSSHSLVNAGGELDYFFHLGTNKFISESNGFLYESLSSYSNELFENIGKTYLNQIEQLSQNSSFITDKLPFNFLMIGFIKLAFPNAKIIHCERNAEDTCLSIYKKNFATDNYRFAYNLKTIGQFYNLYRDIMTHWHEVFPDSILNVKYEKVVEQPAAEIKTLLDYCGLNWEEDCLNFHKTDAVIKTASAYQVRQPIYDSSVNLWKKYNRHLAPLVDELNKYSK